MKKILLLIFVFLFIGAVVLETGTKVAPVNASHEIGEAMVGGETFKTYISDTEELRKSGLSGFPGLKSDEAMLFVFERPDTYGFWMKDMLFAIDILWLDEEFRVVGIEEGVSPESYPKTFYPKSPSLFVLEFAAGTMDRLGVKEGDAVSVSGGK